MKKIVIAMGMAAAMLSATPAAAKSFDGPRVGVVGGILGDDVFSANVGTYGANVGYDFDLGKTVAGATVEYQDNNDTGREWAVSGRVGTKVKDNVLVYGTVGYTNLGVERSNINFDGVRFGLGAEMAVTDHVYAGVEQRYSNYERGLDTWQTALTVGVRF